MYIILCQNAEDVDKLLTEEAAKELLKINLISK